MSRVLVTGATGFIGRPVAELLVSRGEEVHALYRSWPPPDIRGVRWHQADLLVEGEIEHVLGRFAPEHLLHLAWCTGHPRIMHAEANVVWVESSLRMMRAFVRHGGRRLLILGSSAEYDWSDVVGPLSEARSPLAPATLYGAAKDALRRLASVYADQEGIELAWGRPFFLYGPRQSPGRIVSSVICSLLTNQSVAISSGTQVRDYMHVEDLAGAILALLESSVVGDVNLASGIGVTLDEVVDGIVRVTGRPELVLRGALPDRQWEPRLLVADVTRLHDEIGFRQQRTLVEGLTGTVRWWQDHKRRSSENAPERGATQS